MISESKDVLNSKYKQNSLYKSKKTPRFSEEQFISYPDAQAEICDDRSSGELTVSNENYNQEYKNCTASPTGQIFISSGPQVTITDVIHILVSGAAGLNNPNNNILRRSVGMTLETLSFDDLNPEILVYNGINSFMETPFSDILSFALTRNFIEFVYHYDKSNHSHNGTTGL